MDFKFHQQQTFSKILQKEGTTKFNFEFGYSRDLDLDLTVQDFGRFF